MKRWPIVLLAAFLAWTAGAAVSASQERPLDLGWERACRSTEDAAREECLALAEELRQAEARLRELKRDMARRFNRGIYREHAEIYGPDRGRIYSPALPPPLGFLTVLGRRPRLGVNVRMQSAEETDRLGAVLDGVVEDGPAAEAGLQAGDIVTHWDGDPLTGRYPPADDDQSEPAAKLIDLARELEEDQEVELTYLRDGQSHTATVRARQLELPAFVGGGLRYRDLDDDGVVDLALPRIELPRLERLERLGYRFPGMTVFARGGWEDMELLRIGPELGEYFGTERGLLVVEPPSEDPLGLEVGDVILAVGDREPRDTPHLLRILRNYDAGETVNVEVMRHRQRATLSAELPEPEHVELVRPQGLLRDEPI